MSRDATRSDRKYGVAHIDMLASLEFFFQGPMVLRIRVGQIDVHNPERRSQQDLPVVGFQLLRAVSPLTRKPPDPGQSQPGL